MVVLLILFPIVVLEMKYLMPLLTGLNQSLAVFIGNAVSVTLIAYPFTPLAIKALNWWLVPQKRGGEKVSFYGTLLLLAVYGAIIALFWNFL